MALAQPRLQEGAAVTCLAFSTQGNILLVGGADGTLNFWEFRKAGWEVVKTLKDLHDQPIVQVLIPLSATPSILASSLSGLSKCLAILWSTD